MIFDVIAGITLLGVGIIAAFFAGKRKERKENDTNAENTRIATEGKIKIAIRDADNDRDWLDRLRARK